MAKKRQFDEYYSNGKIELARIGNVVSVKNNYSEEEIGNRNKILAAHYDEVVSEINELIDSVAKKNIKMRSVIIINVGN